MATRTSYPCTSVSRWQSHVHDAPLSLALWCLHRLSSWLGQFAYLHSFDHAPMVRESRDAFSQVIMPTRVSPTTITKTSMTLSCRNLSASS